MFCAIHVSGKVILIHGTHAICPSCLRNYLKTKTGGPLIVFDAEKARNPEIPGPIQLPLMPIKCPARNCQYQIQLVTISKAMQHREYDLQLQKAMHAAGISLPDSPKRGKPAAYKCLVCYSETDENNGYQLECGEQFCKACLTEYPAAFTQPRYLNVAFKDGKGIHGLTCPMCTSKVVIDMHVLKELIGQERLATFELRSIKQKYKVFECPSCSAAFIIPQDYKSRCLPCVVCGESWCRLCKQAEHTGVCKHRLKVLFALKA
jgi:hypothetical protein